MNDLSPFAQDSSELATTWPRRRLVLLLMAICFLAHFNRVSMAAAADTRIMAQFDISPTSMGKVYSAFLLAYTLCMIPGGWLIDRRGPRFSLQLVCFGSALFIVLTGCVGLMATSAAVVFPALLMIRALMGAISSPLHPAAARAVSLDIPNVSRSTANGLVTGAALLGVASTFMLFGQLIDWLGWPAAFIVAGLLTAEVGLLWTFYAIPHVPEATAAVAESHSAAQVGANMPQSWLRRNKNLTLLTLSYAAVGYFQYLFFYWMHYYFENVLELGEQQSRFYAAIPPFAMALGMPLGGWLSDRIQAEFGRRAARSGLAIVAMMTSAGLLALGVVASQPFWIVTWLSLALGVLGMVEGPFWVAAVEVGGRRGGLSASIFNTGGNAGGILSPIVTPWVSDSLGYGWQAGIAVGGVVCVVGAALWYWIDTGPTSESNG